MRSSRRTPTAIAMSAAPDPRPLDAVQRAFAAHVRDPANAPAPPDVPEPRMRVYRELFFNNIDSLLAANFPVIRSLHDDDGWHALVRAFYATHRARTPLFTEIGREFVAFLERRAAADAGDPPFFSELARHEWSELALALDEQELDGIAVDPDGDCESGIPIVSPLARIAAYRFPVHRIGPDFRPDAPSPQPTLLMLVRDRGDDVRFLEIDALTALLFERLHRNETDAGSTCVDAMLAELGRNGDGALRASGLAMLGWLRERDAILGTRRDPP